MGVEAMERPEKRIKVSLLDDMEKRLKTYAVAASAAGVSLLALAQTAEAEILYTPVHVIAPSNGGYSIDLNNDGQVDYIIREFDNLNKGDLYFGDDFNGVAGVRHGTGSTSSCYCTQALALGRGATIGPGRQFFFPTVMSIVQADKLGSGGYFYSGHWINVKDRYLGFEFRVNGQFHYGWARMTTHVRHTHIEGVITGYAYEGEANTPIRAGQTSGTYDASLPQAATLGTLARGAVR
jgi:hypothetical protein